MFKRFLPRTTCFFDYFERHSQLIVEACREFQKMTKDPSCLTACADAIHEYEHKADEQTHQCIAELQRTFITPFDRQYIHKLIRVLDDVLDALDEATSRIQLYDITSIFPEAEVQSRVLLDIATAVHDALPLLRNMKNEQAIHDLCIRIHHLENEGDTALRLALRHLFDDAHEPILVIKWKEIFELLEMAIDRCEDVSDIIQGIVIEAS